MLGTAPSCGWRPYQSSSTPIWSWPSRCQPSRLTPPIRDPAPQTLVLSSASLSSGPSSVTPDAESRQSDSSTSAPPSTWHDRRFRGSRRCSSCCAARSQARARSGVGTGAIPRARTCWRRSRIGESFTTATPCRRTTSAPTAWMALPSPCTVCTTRRALWRPSRGASIAWAMRTRRAPSAVSSPAPSMAWTPSTTGLSAG
mmetsp:Transcript_95949/g.277086  ORF Transcript_95949/g.277086 Transcript_95949/m.277086 type:complete len:200 (+) Transcript_95949:819-1418(+)